MLQIVHGSAMFRIASRIEYDHTQQCNFRGRSPPRGRFMSRKNHWQDQSADQDGIERWLNDENDVPGVPLPPKRPKRSHAIVVGEVEQDVTQTGDIGKEEQQSPARRKVGNVGSSSSKKPNQVHDRGDHGGSKYQSRKGMCEATVMGKAVYRTSKSQKDVEVRGLGGKRHGRGGESCFAIESCSSEDGTGQKVSDGLQEIFVTQHRPSGAATSRACLKPSRRVRSSEVRPINTAWDGPSAPTP